MNSEIVMGAALGVVFVGSVITNIGLSGVAGFQAFKLAKSKDHVEHLKQISEEMGEQLKKAGLHPAWGLRVGNPGSPGSGLAKIVKDRGHKMLGTEEDAVFVGIDLENNVEIVVHSSNPHGEDWAVKSLDASEVSQLLDILMDTSTRTAKACVPKTSPLYWECREV